MNTEITDNNVRPPRGWIFYDAECRFCTASRFRWGPIFEQRGFAWVPLQSPGTPERLGVRPELLMTGMWFLPAGERPLGGVDAWIRLMGYVWWLKPLGVVLGLPGIRRLAGAVYRWIARNRHCMGGQCRVPPRPPRAPHRNISFLEFP